MKIDLHVHTQERSPCGHDSEVTLIKGAIRFGLGALVFTDHDRLAPPERLAELNAQYAPFRIFGGIEVSLMSENEHVLVLGVQDPALERGDWTYPQLHAFVRAQGGFLAAAHPFRYRPYIGMDLEAFPPDAIEAYSYNTPKQAIPEIHALAEKLGIPVLSNSDAHRMERVGRYYNELAVTPEDEAHLLTLLRTGGFVCRYLV